MSPERKRQSIGDSFWGILTKSKPMKSLHRDDARVAELRKQLPGELGEAGEEEHVGRGEQLPHHLLRHLAVVGVDEVHDTTEH